MRAVLTSLFISLALSGCGAAGDTGDGADDYAARIGGAGQSQAAGVGEEAAPTAPVPSATGQDEEPLRRAAVPGTHTDPTAHVCGAPQSANILGRIYSEETAAEFASTIPEGARVRVVPYGREVSGAWQPNRLNLMLDQDGVIRDLRCG